MNSLLVRASSTLAIYISLAFSVFLLLRGHNLPGGGFIGGMMASTGIVLSYLAFGRHKAERLFPFNFLYLISFGLMLAILTGFGAKLLGLPFLTSGFWEFEFPVIGHVALSSVLAFDIGVYLVVVGTVVTILQSLAQDAPASPKRNPKPQPATEEDA